MTSAPPQEKNQHADARALFDAAGGGDAASVARLLAEGARADARLAPGGETPLMRAAARGYEEVARVLLDAGADASARRSDGFTPLILAVFFGHEGLVRLLVERGADAGAQTSLGTTAARWASARGFGEMAELLRSAEPAIPQAAAPEVVTPVTTASVTDVTKTSPPVQAATPARTASTSTDEVALFSRKSGRRDSGGAVSRAYALTGGEPVGKRTVEGNVPSSEALPTDALQPEAAQASAARPGAASPDLFSQYTSAGASVRRGGGAPSHASAFRVGDFLRSWQGSVGVALLLLALGVAVFTLVRGGTGTRGGNAPQSAATPQTPAPQSAAQVPTPLAAQPTPAFPTPDPFAVMPVTDPAYAVPGAAGQPFYVPQQGAPIPVQSNVPGDLTVVSESGAAPNANAARPGRGAETNANASTPARPEARPDAGADADARPARTPEPAPRPAQPPAQSNPPPAQQPTPGRAKVIPWPPQ